MQCRKYSYVTESGNKNNKSKDIKKCVIKGKPKFENYGNCLEATQPENETDLLEYKKVDVYCLKENHKSSENQ